MKNFLVLIGSENNVGDHLIVEQGVKILEKNIKCKISKFNRFKEKGNNFYKNLKKFDALILLGGPALRPNFLTKIYKLDFNNIKIPIVALGIGWKDLSGKFYDTFNYRIEEKNVLENIQFGLRDYYSKYCLDNKISANSLVTGCPALYSDKIGVTPKIPKNINKVVFSVGVEFSKSKSLREQTYSLINSLNKEFVLKVVFHHGIGNNYKSAKNFNRKLYSANKKLENYLIKNKIKYNDVSGKTKNFKKIYNSCDLHIGYRVHAHIFCMSINKPTILICEDGRGLALSETISGMYFEAYQKFNKSFLSKLLNKIFGYDRYLTNKGFSDLVVKNLKYEIETNNFKKIFRYRNDIDNLYTNMLFFLKKI